MFMDSPSTPTAESPFASLPPPLRGGSAASASALRQTIHRDTDRVAIVPSLRISTVELKYQNQLVQVRLGLASSLFAALRARHAATAAHCLRVALGCSSWGPLLSSQNQQRDELEVAALLHDIGKIGIPDRSC